MNIFEFRESKLGFTLIEMVVSLVILSILMTSTMGMIISSNSIFISTSKAAIDKQVGNSVFDTLEKLMKYSTFLRIEDTIYDVNDEDNDGDTSEVIDDLPQSFYIADNNGNFTTDAGIIFYQADSELTGTTETAQKLFADAFYSGRKIKYSVESTGRQSVKIVVTVYREDKPVYSRESVVRCVNLDLFGGANGNEINDNATIDYNQALLFSCEELYALGGTDAWSLEYRIQQYLAEYNKILASYYTRLKQIDDAYDEELNKWSSEKNESNKEDTVSNPLSSVMKTKQNQRTQRIFGLDANTSGSTKSTLDPVWDSNDVSDYVNIYDHYKAQINELLGFTPTTAVEEYLTKPKATTPTTTIEYKNPYFGVVASAEELYLGFLLTYYDDNGDKKINVDPNQEGGIEYPTFTNPEKFFEGTTLKNLHDSTASSFITPTEDNGYDYMMILAYFRDNVTNYSDLYQLQGIKSVCYRETTTSTLDSSQSIWIADFDSNGACIQEANDYHSTDWCKDTSKDRNSSTNANGTQPLVGYEWTSKDIKYGLTSIIGNENKTVGKENNPVNAGLYYALKDGVLNKYIASDRTYIKNRIDVNGDGKTSSKDMMKYFRTGERYIRGATDNPWDWSEDDSGSYATTTAFNAAVNAVNATDISTYSTSSKRRQTLINTDGFGYYYVAWDYYTNYVERQGWKETKDTDYDAIITLTTNENLKEGWYYFDSTSSLLGLGGYYLFYLEAVPEAENNQDKDDYDYPVAVKEGGQIILYTNSDKLKHLTYQQAQYKKGGSETYVYKKADLPYFSVSKHQYSDYILYSVDRNSWFATSKGILNTISNVASKAIGSADESIRAWLGAKARDQKASWDSIPYVDETIANLSLGRMGKATSTKSINLLAEMDTNLRSYNAAFLVYNNQRGTWYYIPDQSDFVTTRISDITWTSKSDSPVLLDCEAWNNSTHMEQDIRNGKLSATGTLLGIDRTTDVNWTSVPTTSEQVVVDGFSLN